MSDIEQPSQHDTVVAVNDQARNEEAAVGAVEEAVDGQVLAQEVGDTGGRPTGDQGVVAGQDEATAPVENLHGAIEAICMVSDQPVPAVLMADVLHVSPDRIDDVCAELADYYETQGRGFSLNKVAGGWRYQSHPAQAEHVEKFVLDGQNAKLSGAALETLAIIAYKQPLSRAQIAAIRGVNVDGVLKTLQQRGYVSDLGQSENSGQATLFGTTSLFLERLGIDSLADLPPLGEFVPDADLVEILEQGLRPTAISLDEDPEPLLVKTDEPIIDLSREEDVDGTVDLRDGVATESRPDSE